MSEPYRNGVSYVIETSDVTSIHSIKVLFCCDNFDFRMHLHLFFLQFTIHFTRAHPGFPSGSMPCAGGLDPTRHPTRRQESQLAGALPSHSDASISGFLMLSSNRIVCLLFPTLGAGPYHTMALG